MLYQTVTIREIHEEISGFKTFVFKENIPYQPGQYLTLVANSPHGESRRSYSIISTPVLNESLAIGVKRIENGFYSRQLTDHAKPGDQLLTTGAGGLFTLPLEMEPVRLVFFLAAGSGITPIYSLLKTLLFAHSGTKAALVYSNPSPGRTAFYGPLKGLLEAFPHRLSIRFLFSNSPDLAMARLNRDLLIRLLSEYRVTDYNKTLFYVCGPEAYMRMCLYILQEQGISGDQIKRENFIIEKIRIPKPLPPDKGSYQVQIHLADTTHTLKVNYPESILQAAKNQGISLPYSCETGRCGNCVAECLSGTIWMSYNEVLTESDLKQGLILTCVGHPQNGDAILTVRISNKEQGISNKDGK